MKIPFRVQIFSIEQGPVVVRRGHAEKWRGIKRFTFTGTGESQNGGCGGAAWSKRFRIGSCDEIHYKLSSAFSNVWEVVPYSQVKSVLFIPSNHSRSYLRTVFT